MVFKKSIFLILLICIVSSIFGQTYSSIISDKEILEFLNWKLGTEEKYSEEPKSKVKQIYIGISKWDTVNFFPERKTGVKSGYSGNYFFKDPKNKWLDTIFSQQDKEFLYQQFTSQIDTNWRHSFTNSKLLKSSKQKKPNRYYLSLPLFSQDKKFIIIKQTYYCGSLCAYGGIRIYSRNPDGSWEYIGSLSSWMS